VRRLLDLPLWIGTARDARDIRGVLDASIAAVVDLAMDEPPVQPTRELVYLRFPLVDGGGNPAWVLRAAVEVVAGLLKAEVPTLVACSAGASRSPAIAAIAFARCKGIPPANGLKLIGPGDVSVTLWKDLVAATTQEARDGNP
jgi:protein-tyrosine phosphatase